MVHATTELQTNGQGVVILNNNLDNVQTQDEDVDAPQVLQDMTPEALEKMFQGRIKALQLCQRFNNLIWPDYTPGMGLGYLQSNPERIEILSELFKVSPEKVKSDLNIFPNFLCDYGYNIEFKGNCFINSDCTILDAGKITLGHQVLFGPGVKIFGSGHPIDPDERYTAGPLSFDVTIGDQVWIGGNSTIIGPCKIGNGVVVAAGAVVKKGEYPDDVVIGGNPARILKHITRKSKLSNSTTVNDS